MSSALFDQMMQSPALPELIQEAQRAIGREHKLREKFYADITPEHKWEFILGEVIMHSPALNRHLMASKRFFVLLDAFVRNNDLGLVHTEKAMTSFPRNDYEPDVMFIGPGKMGMVSPDTLKFPIPDLIVEVLSPSTESRDRGIKFEDYALHGVAEYIIVDPTAETVEFYRLAGKVYPPVAAQTEGVLSSDVVPGFEIPVRALFDEAVNAEVMRQIWASKSS